MNGNSNPYSPPAPDSTSTPGGFTLLTMFGWGVWLVLAGGVWIGRLRLAMVFLEFEIPTSILTRLYFYPLTPWILVIVGFGFLTGLMLARTPRQRRTLLILSYVGAIGVVSLGVLALFRPLLNLMSMLE